MNDREDFINWLVLYFFCSNIKPRDAVYDFQPGTKLSMVAEESVPYGEKPKQ